MYKKIKIFVFFIFLFHHHLIFPQALNEAKETVKKLASPEFHGRGYVGKGDEKAADYISDEFKRLGLKGWKKNYFQHFDISINTFPGNLQLKINDSLLLPGVQFLVNPCSKGLHKSSSAIYFNRKELLDERKMKYKLKHNPGYFFIADIASFEDESLHRESLSTIDIIAKDKGITDVGIVLLTDAKLSWTLSNFECNIPLLRISRDAIANRKIQKVALSLENKFYPKYSTRNVAAFLEGKNRDSAIVFSAHYDHLGRMGDDTYFPGANDNASGTAMMLKLAEHYASQPEKPPYDIIFIAFGAEEAGLLGSQYFVRYPEFKLGKIKFLINLDMAGTGDDGITVVNGEIHQKEFSVLKNLNRQYTLLPAVKSRGEACNSDHCLFHLAGVPSFFIYTLGGIQAYHDIYDRYDTLPFTEFSDYFKLLVLFTDKLLQEDY